MEVEVVLRGSAGRRVHRVPVSEGDTVGALAASLSSQAAVPADHLRLIIAGRVLDPSIPLHSLLLGPTTSLVALTLETPSLRNSEDSPRPASPGVAISSFHVFCKGCDGVKKGKLRVHCDMCCSPAVVVRTEPDGWNAVLKSRQIEVDCADCGVVCAHARFSFKCVDCHEVGASLRHIVPNWEGRECCICCSPDPTMFDFGCGHTTCRECFIRYSDTSLKVNRFEFRPPYGYTLSCPYTNCDAVLKDVHHLRILGRERYSEYQRVATEKLVALHESGVFCPQPDCGASFFNEDDSTLDNRVMCPHCYRMFCHACRAAECKCGKDDESDRTILSTTKKCPGCAVATERNGGCAHMTCVSCGYNWCFLCVREWSEQCQWDHWFG